MIQPGSLSNKKMKQKNYSFTVTTVMNGWLITIQNEFVSKNAVVQSDGKDRIIDLQNHLDAIVEELEREML